MLDNTLEQTLLAGTGVGLILLLFSALPLILGIVLFFKVWIMTNDVSKIKDLLQEQLDLEHPYKDRRKDDSQSL